MHIGVDLSQADAMIWLMSRPAETMIVCGLERLGLRIARALIQLGEKVIVFADSPQPAILREARKAGARIVEGRSDAVAELQGVQLATARCLVLTDNADLGNLHAALAARKVNPRLRLVWGSHLTVHSPSGDSGSAARRIEHRPPSEHLDRVRSGPFASSVEHAVELSEGHLLAPVDAPPLPRRRRSVRLRSFMRVARTFFDFRLGVTRAQSPRFWACPRSCFVPRCT